MDETHQVTVTLEADADSDAEELTQFAAQLRSRFLELDIEAVELVRSDQIPVGAKPLDVIVAGALVAMVTPATIKALVSLVETWIKEHPVRLVKVVINGDTLEVQRVSRADQRALVQEFIDRHTNP